MPAHIPANSRQCHIHVSRKPTISIMPTMPNIAMNTAIAMSSNLSMFMSFCCFGWKQALYGHT